MIPAALRPAAALLATLLTACNFAPHYDVPVTAASSRFKEAVPGNEAESGFRPAAPQDEISADWWSVYGDPDLDDLEARVVISNQTVIGAEANYRAARALVAEAQAALYPTLSLDPSVTRSRSSASVISLAGAGVSSAGGAAAGTTVGGTGTVGGAGGTTVPGTGATGAGGGTGATAAGGTGALATTAPRTIYSVPLDLSYQIDLWGSVRNTVAQNRFNALASAAQVATALLSTQSQLAQAYFELRVTDEERRVLATTLRDYQQSLDLVRTLYKNGIDSGEDLAEAESQLATTQAQATDLGVARAQYEHAIAVLIGVPPSQFALPYKRLKQLLPVVPVRVPSDLLERRADVAAAERSVAAANANIGIARAAYFPSLSISASGGYESTTTGNLFTSPNLFWSVGPALAQTLFDGGARRAVTARARALDEAAAASYRQTVLSAFQAVEDNLASLRILSQELKQQHEATAASERTVRLSLIRYRDGVDSYVNVITAQNSYLTSRESELQVQLKQLTASVNLINNLGGGWSEQSYGRMDQVATHPPAADSTPRVPSADAAAEGGGANPPALPDSETQPDDFLNLDQDTLGPSPARPPPGSPPPGRSPTTH